MVGQHKVCELFEPQMQKTRDYKLYAINFHGSALNSIREEFRKQVSTGARRRVFVIDLEEEEKLLATKVRNTKRFDVFAVALSAIEKCRHEYNSISKKIAEEKRFNLIDFWMENLHLPTGDVLPRIASIVSKRGSGPKSPDKAVRRSEKADRASKIGVERKISKLKVPVCPNLAPKRSNKIGRPEQLSRKRYIEDEPEESQLFIAIIGDMDNEFYIKLLSHQEPLQAIVNFLPDECGYDMLLPHPENKEILARTIEEIQVDTYEMRTIAITKETGYLQHYLPVISRCLAKKYSQQIFDELSYYLYDIELLQQQYQRYYIKPFQLTNVEMPAHVNVNDLRETAESLAIQGSYLTKQLPAMTSDSATIIIYFEGLMNQIAQRVRKLTPEQAELTVLPLRESSQLSLIDNLRDVFTTAFESIMKVTRFERLCVAANNQLFRELLLFTNTESFKDIHYTTLEYNALRSYTDNMCLENIFEVQRFDQLTDRDFFPLPYYARLFYGENVVKQNLDQWLKEYSTKDVDEILPNCRLYHFKCAYNEVIEEQQMTLLPTRLCFRDFTLFQLDEFLKALITPEMIETRNEKGYDSYQSLVEQRNQIKLNNDIIDLSIFIRPNSLKWQKLKAYLEAQITQAGDQTNAKELKKMSARTPTHSIKEGKEMPGLPKDHPLLKGYNLEDIRQEIQTKNSKYYFEEGVIKLYEERWCFMDMNKNLLFKVNNKTLNIHRPRFWNTAVSSCLRVSNENEVIVRVLNKETECAKVVINYPNGLAIYHNDTYVQQEWYTEETVNKEQRRIFVAEGAVIVHNEGADMILIMRYNGEIYRLYQYEFPEYEEEAAYNEISEDLGSSIKIEIRDSTVNKTEETTRRTQRNSKAKEAAKELHEIPQTNGSEKEAKSTHKESLRHTSIRKGKGNEATSNPSILLADSIKRRTLKDILVESIDNELRFLNEISNKYGLTYLHLIVTTSMGIVINLTRKGKVYRGHSEVTLEWNDYFANESYAQRGDGVRMIWAKDDMKCYHQDGTLIVTTLAEKNVLPDWDTDDEVAYTMSSSHLEEESVEEENVEIPTSRVLLDGMRSKGSAAIPPRGSLLADANLTKKSLERSPSTHTRSRIFSTMSNYLANGEGEEGRFEDPYYVAYRYDSFHMLHKRYAEVQFELYEVPINDIVVSIKAIDGICAYVYKVVSAIDQHLRDEYTEIPNFIMGDSATGNMETHVLGMPKSRSKSHTTHTEGSEVHTTVDDQSIIEADLLVQTVVKVTFGNDFSITSTEDACEIAMELERFENERDKVRNTLELHFNYAQNIADLFQYFVDEISKFKNYQKPTFKEFYFLEHQSAECNTTGYRFVYDLPKPTDYNFSASNTYVELKNFKNIQQLMTNEYSWYDVDMNKFPRFRLKRERIPPINETFPLVLMANIFVKIPVPLCNTAEIHKFLAPIDNFTFKSTQRILKEAMEYYLRPRIRTELAKLWSTNNWRIKLAEHKHRLFREQQRTVLYESMLKHNVFPKYTQFLKNFYSHVKNIDFFDFIKSRCVITPEQQKAESLSKRKRLEEEQRSQELQGKNEDNLLPEKEKAAEPPKDGLRPRNLSRYRGKPQPKCITTITHISDQPNVSVVLTEVLNVLENFICERWIKFNYEEAELHQSKLHFYNVSRIPGIIGCVDGTHIKIVAPKKELQNLYYNRKGFYIINAMIVCDHSMTIRYINAKYLGATHDSCVFNMSALKSHLEQQEPFTTHQKKQYKL
ncbi:uncharacterized protein ms(2)34Fe [Eurosta solidaginis]|uniref:uncharacterized protein ms(2)34Fe n=1 Tax=Eurosta solidaginis TaxID=178769 RepID=UPI0035316A16